MASETSPGFNFFFGLIWLWWMITSVTWLIRNPIANTMTTFTRFSQVVRFHKMAEYQVQKTYVSID